jgi:putative C-S lyase
MYDFTSMVDRSGTGAAKWENMKKANPRVPPGIIPFSVADMEFKAMPEITQGLKAYLDGLVLGYTVATDAYFEAVCGWMRETHRWDIKPEWITTSDGVVSAFFNAVKALTEPGDGVIIMPPVYYPFYSAIERNKRRIIANNLINDNGRYVVDYEDLEVKAKDPRNKALLFCSPHNPVGRVWEKEELLRIGRICLENGVVIISDEIHFDLIMPGYTHTVFASLGDDIAGNTITCTAPSKTFNLAGLHTSNIIISNKDLRNRYRKVLLQNKGVDMLNVFGYKACEIAYTRGKPWLAELLAVIEQNRITAEAFLAKHFPRIKVTPMEGTYLQWWDCRGLGLEYKALERFMTQDALLFLDEGYVFGQCGQGFERINLACPTRALEQALERFAAAGRAKGIIA